MIRVIVLAVVSNAALCCLNLHSRTLNQYDISALHDNKMLVIHYDLLQNNSSYTVFSLWDSSDKVSIGFSVDMKESTVLITKSAESLETILEKKVALKDLLRRKLNVIFTTEKIVINSSIMPVPVGNSNYSWLNSTSVLKDEGEDNAKLREIKICSKSLRKLHTRENLIGPYGRNLLNCFHDSEDYFSAIQWYKDNKLVDPRLYKIRNYNDSRGHHYSSLKLTVADGYGSICRQLGVYTCKSRIEVINETVKEDYELTFAMEKVDTDVHLEGGYNKGYTIMTYLGIKSENLSTEFSCPSFQIQKSITAISDKCWLVELSIERYDTLLATEEVCTIHPCDTCLRSSNDLNITVRYCGEDRFRDIFGVCRPCVERFITQELVCGETERERAAAVITIIVLVAASILVILLTIIQAIIKHIMEKYRQRKLYTADML